MNCSKVLHLGDNDSFNVYNKKKYGLYFRLYNLYCILCTFILFTLNIILDTSYLILYTLHFTVVLMDKLGKLLYNKPELLYYYKGVVACPPLQMVDDVLGVQNCSPQSLQLNTVINTFMELEKLTLSRTKCHNMHMGKNRRSCQNLQVHGGHMEESKSGKYLGDIVHNSGSIKPNMARRLSRGWSRVSEILALVKEAPLGKKRIEAGLLLRKSLLINATMFNSEAWHGLTKSQIIAFEKIDESLIKGLMVSHAKIPIPALYLETGQVPIQRPQFGSANCSRTGEK